MILAHAFGEEVHSITKEQGISICHIYKENVGEQGSGDNNSIINACNAIHEAFPNIFTMDKIPVLRQ